MSIATLLEIALVNALAASVLAVVVWLVTRWVRNAYIAHVLWCVVLLKLVTPPIVSLPISLPNYTETVQEQPPVAAVAPAPQAINTAQTPAIPPWTPTTFANVKPHFLFRTPLATPETQTLAPVVAPRPPSPATTLSSTEAATIIASTESAITDTTPVETAPAEWIGMLAHWPMFVGAFWLAGSLAVAVVILLRMGSFGRRLKRMLARDASLEETAGCVAARLGMRRAPTVRLVAAPVGPLVWAGWWSPLVIVPNQLWRSLDLQKRETLIAHEFAHLIRRDHWVRRGEVLLITLYWWLPTVWWAIRQREIAAESCCDALVLNNFPEQQTAYAQTLIQALELSSARSPVLLSQGLGRMSHLKGRLTMIVQNKKPRRLGKFAWLLLTGLSVGLLGISAEIVRGDGEGEKGKPAQSDNGNDSNGANAAKKKSFFGNQIRGAKMPGMPGMMPESKFGPGMFPGGFGGFGFGAGMMPAGGKGGFGFAGKMPGGGMMPGGKFGSGMFPGGSMFPGAGKGGFGFGGKMPGAGMFPGGGKGGFGFAAMMPGAGGGKLPGAGMMPGEKFGKKQSSDKKDNNDREKEDFGVAGLFPGGSGYGGIYGGGVMGAGMMAPAGSISNISPEVQKKMRERLRAIALDESESLKVRLSAIEAATAVNVPLESVDKDGKLEAMLWKVVLQTEEQDLRGQALNALQNMKSVPPTVEHVQRLSELIIAKDHGGSSVENIVWLLNILTNSDEGLQRLIKAIEATKKSEPGEARMMIGNIVVTSSPRVALQSVLKNTIPRNDASVKVLLKALDHKDAGIRAAAISALGNLRTARGGMMGGGMMGMSGGVMGFPGGMAPGAAYPGGGGYPAPGAAPGGDHDEKPSEKAEKE